jgi:type IV pilus assembly protein PilZ
VIWISQKQTGIKPQGFAIQLSGEKGIITKMKQKSFWQVVI